MFWMASIMIDLIDLFLFAAYTLNL